MKSISEWYDEIYREHGAYLEKLARSLLKDKHYAEDIVQDTFEYLLLNYEEAKTKHNMRAYLTAILRKKIMTRNQLFFHEREVELDLEHVPTVEENYGDSFRDGLPGELTDEERDILCLFYDYGYTHKEIGKLLGCSPFASSMRLLRARLRYKDLVGEDGQPDKKRKRTAKEAPKENIQEKSEERCYNPEASTNIKDRRCDDV